MLILLHVIRPKPPQRIGQDRAAVLQVVLAFAVNELVIPAHEIQRRRHLLIGQRPVAVRVVEVISTGLQEHLHRFLLGVRGQK